MAKKMTTAEFIELDEFNPDDMCVTMYSDTELADMSNALDMNKMSIESILTANLDDTIPESVKSVYDSLLIRDNRIFIYKDGSPAGNAIVFDEPMKPCPCADYIRITMDDDGVGVRVGKIPGGLIKDGKLSDKRHVAAAYYRCVAELMLCDDFINKLNEGMPGYMHDMAVVQAKRDRIDYLRGLHAEYERTMMTDRLYAAEIAVALDLINNKYGNIEFRVYKGYAEDAEAFKSRDGAILKLNMGLHLNGANYQQRIFNEKNPERLPDDTIEHNIRTMLSLKTTTDDMMVSVHGRDIVLSGLYDRMMHNQLRVDRMDKFVEKALIGWDKIVSEHHEP